MNNQDIAKAISVLFGAYGKADDINRQAIYCKACKDIPLQLLVAGIDRAIDTRSYLPSVADLKDDCRQLAEMVDDRLAVLPWPEAWKEIQRVLAASYWTEKPEFSTPEIAETIACYGWRNLYEAENSSWQAVHAQLRDIYKTICDRKKDGRVNNYIAKKHNLQIGGGFKSLSEIVQSLVPSRE